MLREVLTFRFAESLRVWLAKPGDRKALPLKALSKAKHLARCEGSINIQYRQKTRAAAVILTAALFSCLYYRISACSVKESFLTIFCIYFSISSPVNSWSSGEKTRLNAMDFLPSPICLPR